jgi:hypothetical protein
VEYSIWLSYHFSEYPDGLAALSWLLELGITLWPVKQVDKSTDVWLIYSQVKIAETNPLCSAALCDAHGVLER